MRDLTKKEVLKMLDDLFEACQDAYSSSVESAKINDEITVVFLDYVESPKEKNFEIADKKIREGIKKARQAGLDSRKAFELAKKIADILPGILKKKASKTRKPGRKSARLPGGGR